MRGGAAYTLRTEGYVAIFDARGGGDGNISPTITGDHNNRITDYTAVVLQESEEVNNGDEILERRSDSRDVISQERRGGVRGCRIKKILTQ